MQKTTYSRAKARYWQLGFITLMSATVTGVSLLPWTTAPVLAQAQPSALSQERMYRTLTVTGQGSTKIASTLALVQLGVEAQGKTAQQAQQEVANRSAAVVALLKSRKVDKLQTTGINLSPQYSYNNGKQTLTGYQASNTVSFQVPTTQAGTLMDEAVKVGASRIDSVSFMASETAIADAQKIALSKATEEAQAQARAVLSVLGLVPKDIVGIQINGASPPPPRPVPVGGFAVMKTADAAPTTPVEAGEQTVDAAVTLQISY